MLSTLNDRLTEIQNSPTQIVKSLVCDGLSNIDYSNHKITTGQENAIKMSMKQKISFIWGPPGTGKTETLAKISLSHIKQGNKVLMLSYSNVSVDGAILRIHKLAPETKPGVLVRYGYVRQKELLENNYLTSYNLAIYQHPELQEERDDLIEERKHLLRDSPRYVEIEQRLNKIREELSIDEKETVSHASFVATTVSKAIVDNTIKMNDFDVVIFDEASMAYIPQIVYSASLAKKHFICMGDFRQLPPIVQSSKQSILNNDIFQYCGITNAIDKGYNHKWLCMLDTQYRMHPDISYFVSQMMYNGLLHSAEGIEENRLQIVEESPFKDFPIGFADLSDIMSVCMKTSDNSHINILSAFISFAIALTAAKTHEVGIITPYHAQSRLLHAMTRDVAESSTQLKNISCATVHQFQGSEKDVIIYDAVDCYRFSHPGLLLTSMANNYANRLFNVALTRSKGKFIGVGNVDYFKSKNLSHNLLFEQMIQFQQKMNTSYKGKNF